MCRYDFFSLIASNKHSQQMYREQHQTLTTKNAIITTSKSLLISSAIYLSLRNITVGFIWVNPFLSDQIFFSFNQFVRSFNFLSNKTAQQYKKKAQDIRLEP